MNTTTYTAPYEVQGNNSNNVRNHRLLSTYRGHTFLPRYVVTAVMMLLMLCSGVGNVWGEVLCSYEFSNTGLSKTEDSATGTNCTVSWSSLGGTSTSSNCTVLSGVAYWKLTSDDAYVKVTLNDDSFKSGDVLTIDAYMNSTSVSKGFYKKSRNGNKIAQTGTKAAQTFTYTLTAADINDDGSISLYRIDSNSYIHGLSVSGTRNSNRSFTNFKINFTGDWANATTVNESTTYYVTATTDEGVPTYTSEAQASYLATFKGKYHGNTYGISSNPVITIPVDGPVKIYYGTNDYGADVTVTNSNGENVGTFNTNGGKWKSSNSTENLAMFIYNNETATTLTLKGGGYIPYIKVEACDYIPQVTVSYYDTDGHLIGNETVAGGSALSYKYGADNVTIAEGYVFRGWYDAASNGKKVAEGTLLTADTKLYAVATKEEKAEEGNSYTYNFTDSYFDQEDHECITMTNGSFHNTKHGWAFKSGSTIQIPVTEHTKITLGLCAESTEAKITATAGSTGGTLTPDNLDAKVEDDGTEGMIEYIGPATTLTLTMGSTTYIHNVKVEYLVLPDVVLVNQITTTPKLSDDELDANAGELKKTTTTYNISSRYIEGETVTITATAGYGYKLTGFVCDSGDGKGTLGTPSILANGKSGTVEYTVGTATGTVTAQYERLTMGGKIRLESANPAYGSVNFADDDIHANFYTKGTGYVESNFVVDDNVTAVTDASDGYVFEQWTDASDNFVSSSNSFEITVTDAVQTYKASFLSGGHKGTVIFDITKAILQDKDGNNPVTKDITTSTLTDADVTYSNTALGSSNSYSFSIPKYQTLFVSGYTLVKWVDMTDNSSEYQLGKNYAFSSDNQVITLVPVFKANPLAQFNRVNEPTMEYYFGTGKGIRAQNVNLGSNTKTYWTTQVYVEAIENAVEYKHWRDVAIYVNTGSTGYVRNGDLDEWASFGPGTKLYIASCYDTKVEICCYAPITTTTFGGESFVLDESKSDVANHLYVYSCTTESTDARVPIIIGDDYSYYKYIKVYSKKASRVKLYDSVDYAARGKIDKTEAVNTDVDTPIEYLADGGYTFHQGNAVKITFERFFGYEFDKIVDTDRNISVLEAVDDNYVKMVTSATSTEMETVTGSTTDNVTTWGSEDLATSSHVFYFKKIEPTTEEKAAGQRTKYEVSFNISTHRNLKICFKEKPTYYITYNPGQYATGTAPAAEWVEAGDSYTIPKNHTLYYEGNTLKYWVDESNNKKDIGTSYTAPADNVRLFPVFEKNTFTILDITDTEGTTATWKLTQPEGAPVITYERSSGILVTQLEKSSTEWIDLKIDLDASDKTEEGGTVHGKFNNDSKDYPNRCQINQYSILTFPTTKNCEISLTAQKTVAAATIAGTTVGESNVQTAKVTYAGSEATQNVEFKASSGYYTKFAVTYMPQAATEKPELASVSYGTNSLDSDQLTTIKGSTRKVTVTIDPDVTNETMPQVSATATNGGILSYTQATVTNPQATIVMKNANGVLIDTYTINFTFNTPSTTPTLKKITVNHIECTLNATDDTKTVLADQPVNGVIELEFDRTMQGISLPLHYTFSDGIKYETTLTAKSGKTLTFNYWGMPIGKEFNVYIQGGVFMDIYGAKCKDVVRLRINSATTPISVQHKIFDYVVPRGGDVNAAITAANAATGTDRYYVFIPDGDYLLTGNENITPTKTSDGTIPCDRDGVATKKIGTSFNNSMTAITRANVSLIGQSQDGVVLHNNPEIEGISYTATIHAGKDATDFYAEEMTLNNDFTYWNCMDGGSNAARAVAFWDQGNRSIMKNVSMMSWQDTYYSSNASSSYRGYFENCKIGGVVDWLCGDGDIWLEKCDIIVRDRSGNNLAAPATETDQQWGYVFNNCNIIPEPGVTLEKLNGKDWSLARPWGSDSDKSPACTFLNTKMSILPRDAGWGAMGTSLVLRFHEYNTMDAYGTKISLGARSLAASNPAAGSDDCILTQAKAGQYTIENVMGDGDSFNPVAYTQQIDAKSGADADKDANTLEWDDGIEIDDDRLQWNTCNMALCYFIFKKDEDTGKWLYITNVAQATESETTTGVSIEQYGSGTYCVRAANQRGGLGAATKEIEFTVSEKYTLNIKQVGSADDNFTETATNYGWSTICLPYNSKVPTVDDEGKDVSSKLNVYAGTSVSNYSLLLTKVDVINANVGYVVYGPIGNYTFASSSHTTSTETILEGNPEKYDISKGNNNGYVLAYKTTYGLGFYKYTGETLVGNRAWLPVDKVSSSTQSGVNNGKAIKLVFAEGEEPTGISEHETFGSAQDNGDVYTVDGLRVKTPIRGHIYIINGKKVQYK